MITTTWDFAKVKANAPRVADILKGMAHPTRLIILCSLSSGEKPVHDLEEAADTSQSNVSQHLAKLRGLGLLEKRKEANLVYYRIKDESILGLISSLQQTFC